MCNPNCERCKGAIDFRCACGEFPVEGCKCDLPTVPPLVPEDLLPIDAVTDFQMQLMRMSALFIRVWDETIQIRLCLTGSWKTFQWDNDTGAWYTN